MVRLRRNQSELILFETIKKPPKPFKKLIFKLSPEDLEQLELERNPPKPVQDWKAIHRKHLDRNEFYFWRWDMWAAVDDETGKVVDEAAVIEGVKGSLGPGRHLEIITYTEPNNGKGGILSIERRRRVNYRQR